MIEAIQNAQDIMMERDPGVVVMGEDVGYFGGVFRCTAGLQKKYGKEFKAPKLLVDMAASGETFYGRFDPYAKEKQAA